MYLMDVLLQSHNELSKYRIAQNCVWGNFGKSIVLEFCEENVGEFKLLTFS